MLKSNCWRSNFALLTCMLCCFCIVQRTSDGVSQEKWVLCLEIMGWGSDATINRVSTRESNTFFNVHNLPHARQVPDLMNPSTSPPLRILRRTKHADRHSKATLDNKTAGKAAVRQGEI